LLSFLTAHAPFPPNNTHITTQASCPPQRPQAQSCPRSCCAGCSRPLQTSGRSRRGWARLPARRRSRRWVRFGQALFAPAGTPTA